MVVPQFTHSLTERRLDTFQVWVIIKSCYEYSCRGFYVDISFHFCLMLYLAVGFKLFSYFSVSYSSPEAKRHAL